MVMGLKHISRTVSRPGYEIRGINMFGFLKNRVFPIGVDIGDDALKLAQLENSGNSISLIAGGSENRPADVKPGSGDWQRWAIEAIKKLTANERFRGRDVIAAIPASEMFIDHIKMPKIGGGVPNAKKGVWGTDDKLQEAILSKIKQKLPVDPAHAMVKYIPTEQDNVLVIAAEREKIDRHLAIYEKTNLRIKSIGVWPMALTNSYTSFFGRRKTDIEAIVCLLDIQANCTNVVICRHKNLLFARSIPIGAKQISTETMVTRLVLELTACRRHFDSMYRNARTERLIFLSGQTVDKDVCTTIAKQLEMPAQMGNCLAAVKIPTNQVGSGIDRRECQFSWATAFGLSLS